jgi:hypothetical protein
MPNTTLSPEERHMRIMEAARRYMGGEMSMEEYHEAWRLYSPHYLAILRKLGELNMRERRYKTDTDRI